MAPSSSTASTPPGAADVDGPGTAPPTPGFLAGERPIFAQHHRPAATRRDIAYVLCPPGGYEAVQTYHALVRLGQTLASDGFHVFRIDYDGTGESWGSDTDPERVSRWMDSIRRALTAARGLPGVERVGLVGVRLGGSLAAAVAAEVEVAQLVLWEPVASGRQYVREMEIVAAATLALRGPDGEPPEGNGGRAPVEAAGYLLTPGTLNALEGLERKDAVPAGAPDVLLVLRDDRPPDPGWAGHFQAAGCDTTVARLPGHREMMVPPARSRPPAEILREIRAWVGERSTASAEYAPPAGSPLRPAVAVDGISIRAVRFGAGNRLFGVVTEPEPGAGPSRPGVILLAGGAVPRTAVNRMYVDLSRRLARRGHPVLRMDVSGIAESAPRPGASYNDPFPPGLLDDVAVALDWTAEAFGAPATWLVGLCSGAYASFQTACRDPRVRGTILVNGLAFYPDAAVAGGTPAVRQFESRRGFREAVFDPARWRRLLTPGRGKALVAVALARLRTAAASAGDRAAARLGLPARGLAADLARLLDRGVDVSLLYAEGDPGEAAVAAHLGPRLAGLRSRGLATLSFPGADHTFNARDVRERLLRWIVARIADGPGGTP